MYTLLISIALLVLGYFLYGSFIERVVRPDLVRKTPAYTKADGVDYVAMPTWKVFMIQFLNIAGTGPIFGAILGAKYGPACYLWIVLGSIFGGAVHDYMAGMLSIKNGGVSLPTIVGDFLGKRVRNVMLAFTVFLLVLVGAVFIYSPAVILGGMTGDGGTSAVMTWVGIVTVYYVIATLVPIDKIIGKIYPLFAFALIFMAVALLGCLLVKWPSGVPEIWDGLQNRNPSAGSIFPCMFISIACGAISGFHATQSPLMARCMKSEKNGRPVFYGAMIVEGCIALVWATISSYFFYAGGNVEMGAENVTAAPAVVNVISRNWLGTFGSMLAMLGVVAAPITSGDTSLRTARMIIADAFNIDQKPIFKRLLVAIPLFIVTAVLLWFNISDADGFDVIWRYFGWANQALSIFTFWALTIYLAYAKNGFYYLITLIPASFMTAVCLSFISTAKFGFNLPESFAPYIGLGTFAICFVYFLLKKPFLRSPRKDYDLSRES